MYAPAPIRTSDYPLGSNACPSNRGIRPLRRRIVASAFLLVRRGSLVSVGSTSGTRSLRHSQLGADFLLLAYALQIGLPKGVKFPGRRACI